MFRLFAKTPAPAYRPIGPERSFDCAAIHAASFSHPWSETDFEQLMLGGSVVADGAIEVNDGSLAGFILSRIALDEAEILTIAVVPERRRCGIAQMLLLIHLRGLAARRVSRLFLEVDADNIAARALYARHGFHQVAERKAYYRKGDATRASALVMRRDFDGQHFCRQDFAGQDLGGPESSDQKPGGQDSSGQG
jgi:[ribosomal protein S18]-alanine N-acetyltransferase